ncbi:MAG: helix-turn-helix domain-containing protein [Chloroflexi bacterium]|nr:helix-turn-helix domain-containing protein [Chloroflexota bacterium]
MDINGTECVTIDNAAKLLEVSSGRVRQFIAEGRLHSIKVGSRLNMIPLRDVEQFASIPRKQGRKKAALDNK